MGVYKHLGRTGQMVLLSGGALLIGLGIGGCEPYPTAYQVSGTIKSEQRTTGWYQVGLEKYPGSNTLEIRFHGNRFDIEELDRTINPGTKLTVVGRKVDNKKIDADEGYDIIADAIDDME